jgi:peptidoglycan DL-endopeptidase CwlO
VLCLAALPSASAVDGDGDGNDPIPSKERIRHVQQQAETTAERVHDVKAELAAADQRLEAASIEAAKAAEAYNGARYKLHQARAAARRAARNADAAAADVRRLANQLSKSVVAGFENGGSLTSLGILVSNPDPDALLDHLDAYAGVSGALQSDLDDYESAKVIADVLSTRADNALDEQQAATRAAADAKLAAEAAVANAQAMVSSIAAEKDRLLHQLARLQHISVALARQRQQALEQRAAERAAERRAERAAKQAAQEQQQQQQQEAESNPPADQTEPSADDTNPPADNTEPPADNTEPPADNTEPPADNTNPPKQHNDPPATHNDPPKQHNDPPKHHASPPHNHAPKPHGARAAVRFAKRQLGEPYVYGADGPSSWDCSGLTMKAWRHAGVSLSHWSVAQYYETTPISFSQIRRGDLLFWGGSSDPDSIYHVAMYLGNGMMIQAPRPGRSVEIVSIYYWILPNFYTRV